MSGDREALWRGLRIAEEEVARAVRDKLGGKSRQAEGKLKEGQDTVRKLQSVQGIPADERRRLAEAGARLESQRAALEAQAAEVARGELLGGDGDADGGQQARGPARRKKAAEASKEEDQRATIRAATQARDGISQTLGQFQEVRKRLDETANDINASGRQFDLFDVKMKDASQLLGQLKRRTEEDSKYVWWAFLFFLSVVAYIVMRRLKVFRMMYFGASWTLWAGSTAGNMAHGTASGFLSMWAAFTDTLGIEGFLPWPTASG